MRSLIAALAVAINALAIVIALAPAFVLVYYTFTGCWPWE